MAKSRGKSMKAIPIEDAVSDSNQNMVSVQFSRKELEKLRVESMYLNMTIHEFVRAVALGEI